MVEQRTDIRFQATGEGQVLRVFRGLGSAASDSFNRLTEASRPSTRALGLMSQAATGLGTSLTLAGRSAVGFVAATAGIASVTAGLTQAGRAAIDFEAELANVETLLDISAEGTATLRRELVELPPTLGSSAALARGLYQTLSAGVEPANAVRFVGEAAAFARTALTDTSTAVDVITTAVNAYGLASTEAGRIADIFFETIRAGKTTGEELAGALGPLLPLSARLGVTLEEAGAAVATLTASGLNTAESVTALRSAFTNFIQEADQFRAVGIDILDVISRQGLLGALQALQRVTDGNIEIFRRFIPDVQGLTATLSLASGGAETFARNLQRTQESTGAVTAGLARQANTVRSAWTELTNEFDRFVQEIAPLVLPGMQAITREASALARGINLAINGPDEVSAESRLTNNIEALRLEIEKAEEASQGVGARITAALGLGNLNTQALEDLRRQLEQAEGQLSQFRATAAQTGEATAEAFVALPDDISKTVGSLDAASNSAVTFESRLRELAGIEPLSAVNNQIVLLNNLLSQGGTVGELEAIRSKIAELDGQARRLRLGAVIDGLSETAETADEAFQELQDTIDGFDTGNATQQAAAFAEETERLIARTDELGINFDELARTIDGSFESVSTAAERAADDTEREFERMESALQRLTNVRPLREIEQDVQDLERALRDTDNPREIRAIQEALRELNREANMLGPELELAIDTAGSAIDRFFQDLAGGSVDVFDIIAEEFRNMLARMAADAARSQIEPILRSSLGSLFGGTGGGAGAAPGAPTGLIATAVGPGQAGPGVGAGAGAGASGAGGLGGAGAAGPIAIAGIAAIQGIQALNSSIQGLRSDNREERVEARGRLALQTGGIALGGVGGLLIDQLDQQFAGGALSRAIGGLLSGDAPSLSVTIATAISDEIALASGQIEDLTGSISTPFGRLLVTDIDDISKSAAREVARFVQSIDRDAAAFLNEAQINAVSRTLNLSTFDQSFRQRIDEDNLADIMVERFGSIFEAAAQATPGLLAVSPGQFRGNIFAGIDEDDLDAVQRRVTDVGQLLQTITRLSTDRDITDVELALRAIEDTFRPLRQAADDLGLSLQNLAVLQQQATQDLRDDFAEGIGDAIAGLEDPLGLAQTQVLRNRDSLLRQAEALGLSTAQIERLTALQLEQVEIQREQQRLATNIQVGGLNRQLDALRNTGRETSSFVTSLEQLRVTAEQLRAEMFALSQLPGVAAFNLGAVDEALREGVAGLATSFRDQLLDQALALTDSLEFEEMRLERAFQVALEAARTLEAASNQSGLVSAVNLAFNAQRENLAQLGVDFDRRIAGQILGFTDEIGLLRFNLEQQQTRLLDELERVGGDRAQLDALFELQQQALEAQIESNRIADQQTELDRIEDFLTGLIASPSSPLAPTVVLQNARDVFRDALGAQDTTAVLSAANDLLAAGRDVFAAGPGFFDIFNDIRSQVGNFAASIGGENLDGFQNLRDSIQDQTDETRVLLQQVIQALNTGNAGNDAIRASLQRIANQFRPGVTA